MQPPQFAGWAQTWHDDSNTENRLLAIRAFGKAMMDPIGWKQCWEDGGGTSGILCLLSLGSVREVKAFCGAIRTSNRRGKKSCDRERAVEELVKALLPQHYPSTELRTQDKRPLQKFYGRMLRGCSSSFVEQILDAYDISNPLFQGLDIKRLLLAHDDMLKRRLTNYLIHDGPQISKSEIDICFREFVFREPPSPSAREHMSASMQFALELLQARLVLKFTADRWPRSPSELEVLMSIYRRLTRKSRSADRIFLIKLGFQLMELKPIFKRTSDASVLWSTVITLWKKHPRQYEDLVSHGIRLGLNGSILSEIAARWKEDPDQYEHLLIQALGRGLGGSAEGISEGYSKVISPKPFSNLSPELRWRLLRIYCQHVPENGIDIETSSDFACLANQQWSFEVVDKLDREHAILFLKQLYKTNPNFDFLEAPRSYRSIYAMQSVSSRRNFNVELLLTTYHQDDVHAQQGARNEVDRLRKTAATSREQGDRALFAKASVYYSIATGDLEVYAETLIWQQRFIRDPLTAQSVFGSDAILTSEGVALLSGIILPLAEGTTLSTVGQRLAMANQMLKSLNDAARMAKKEPSHSHTSWTGFRTLYADVYRERTSRAKQVKLQPRESEPDMFHIIWLGTVDLARSIGSDFLSGVSFAILDLLGRLSGSSLVAASETLADFAAEWRKKDDHNEDHGNITATMERLSFQAVLKLTRINTPMLSQGLIQRAIIDHPAASSWHRQFLSIGYMRNLPARAAEAMLLSFAAAIGEKLEEQSYVKVGDSEPPKSAPPQSLIKVSTVKYLAQLLNNADFIAPDSAIEVLIELFKAGTHIDVRLATLESLLSTLETISGDTGEQWRSHPMVEKILSTLEIVIPITGNINERRPISESDWAEAKEKVTVPTTAEEDSDIPPLFKAILEVTIRYPSLRKLQGELFSHLVLPTLHYSQEQHRNWFSLFLAKYRPALNVGILPRVPISPRVWHDMLDHQGHLLPSSIIDEYNQYILLRMRMPADIQEFNKTLRCNATLRNDTNVNHWLSIFDELEPLQMWRREINYLLNLIISPVETASPIADLVDAVVSQASLLLDDYESCVDEWFYLVASLGPKNSGPDSDYYSKDMMKNWDCWRKATHSLAQGLITLLERKMTSRAGRDDAVLPSTFPLRLWCLPYPDPHSIQLEDEECHHLVARLDSSLLSFLASDEGDNLLWARLANDAYTTLVSVYTATTTRLRIAVHVGDLSICHGEAVPAMQLIKVAVALKLVGSVSKSTTLRKPRSELTPEQSTVGELVRRLRTVMDQCVQSGRRGAQAPAGVRDMILQWKGRHKVPWQDICSWDTTHVTS